MYCFGEHNPQKHPLSVMQFSFFYYKNHNHYTEKKKKMVLHHILLIHITNTQLKHSLSLQMLSHNISDKFSWWSHTYNITTTASQRIGFLFRDPLLIHYKTQAWLTSVQHTHVNNLCSIQRKLSSYFSISPTIMQWITHEFNGSSPYVL